MIHAAAFIDALKERGVGLFTGVPDSLLSSLCALLDDHSTPGEHIISANEGNAIALAAGFHLSSGKIGAVYMQNSGLGNCVNPLTSLTDPDVYRIPMILIVGWRGEPGVKDEPQHVKQGRITEEQLRVLEIPFWHLDATSNMEEVVSKVFASIAERGAPAAILVRKGAFKEYKKQTPTLQMSNLRREAAVECIVAQCSTTDLLVSTTGKTSRELYECRVKRNEKQRDFLTVGSMGHTLSIALGVALGNPKKRVVCLDGDGSLLMHMGSLPIAGSLKPANLLHVVFNNSAHESVGGQPTVAGKIDFKTLVTACGYSAYEKAHDEESLRAALARLQKAEGPAFLEVLVEAYSRDDLGRPKSTPEQNKLAFIEAARG